MKYKFLQYVANGNGIRFADAINVNSTLRFDHSKTVAAGSTKQNPIPVLRNAINLHDRELVVTCEGDCGISVPVSVTLSWSAPSGSTKISVLKERMIAVLTAQFDDLNAGFLPSTNDITVGE